MAESVKRTCLYIILIVLVIIALPLLFPLLIGGVIASLINNTQLKQRYRMFLEVHDELIFFCYSDRRNKHDWVEQNILPHLDPTLNVIFVEGSVPKSDFDPRCISVMLDNVMNEGCPNLMRITNRKVLDTSLQQEMQSILDQNLDSSAFIQLINTRLKQLD